MHRETLLLLPKVQQVHATIAALPLRGPDLGIQGFVQPALQLRQYSKNELRETLPPSYEKLASWNQLPLAQKLAIIRGLLKASEKHSTLKLPHNNVAYLCIIVYIQTLIDIE